MPINIAFWGGQCLLHSVPFHERFEKIKQQVEMIDSTGFLTYPEVVTYVDEEEDEDGNLIEVVPFVELSSPNCDPEEIALVNGSFEETLVGIAKEYGWEGWVIHDPFATLGEKAFNTRGKYDRPKEVAKLKPDKEADFIVRYDPDNGIGERGKGRKSVGVGSVFCYLWDPEKEEEVYVGKCGNGLSEEAVLKYADPKLYPMVWQIGFATWTKSGSFEHPKLLMERDDKELEECAIQQNPDWESHYR